jgi:subtilisin family serine protease
MSVYNVVYTGDTSNLVTSLTSAGITVNKTFEALKVLNVTSDSSDFSQFAQILVVEEDIETTPVLGAWALNRVNSKMLPMRNVYTPRNYGDNVVVYVVDSGIDWTHPELTHLTPNNLYSYDENFQDIIGHGTAIASLVAGMVVGASKYAVLKSVKIQSGVPIPVSDLLTAFNVILTDHNVTPTVVKVVNCSWSVAKSQILDLKIQELKDAGLVVVASAGNTVSDANLLSPVGLNTVIGVGACDAYDRVINWGPAAGSNWGPDVDITAPGIDVEYANVSGGLMLGSGTSFAAALVSGLICQYISAYPTKTAAEIQSEFLAAGLPDMLFRNETIYGTTPNLLAQALAHEELFTSPTQVYYKIQRGTELIIPITVLSPAVAVRIDDILFGTHVRDCLPWVTRNSNGELVVSPPADLLVGGYRMFLEALDENNQSLEIRGIRFGVYNIDPNEVDSSEPDQYYSHQEDGTVVVRLDACVSSCFDTCSESFKEGQCACIGGGCSTF